MFMYFYGFQAVYLGEQVWLVKKRVAKEAEAVGCEVSSFMVVWYESKVMQFGNIKSKIEGCPVYCKEDTAFGRKEIYN